jgi:hypothetical protein
MASTPFDVLKYVRPSGSFLIQPFFNPYYSCPPDRAFQAVTGW